MCYYIIHRYKYHCPTTVLLGVLENCNQTMHKKVPPTNHPSNHPTNDSMIHIERGARRGGIGV